jgi:hypothetical protein
MDNFVLADRLRGNTRLKCLRLPTFSSSKDGNPESLAIAGALKENKGLVDLDLRFGERRNLGRRLRFIQVTSDSPNLDSPSDYDVWNEFE